MPLLDQPLGRVLLVLILLALASAGLALARSRDGAFRPVPHRSRTAAASAATGATAAPAAPALADADDARAHVAPAAPEVLTAEDLGHPLGARATLLQLSSPGCATCPQVRRVLSGLAAQRPGVVHVEIDASQRLDLARRLAVLRTPTVLVLGPDGTPWARASGRLDATTAARALDEQLATDPITDLEVSRA
ncbi:thioredoxin family protein [Actinotalea fermentans]|uniref:Thioredoxin domain-containing protein n=1 Tax=Actinotalea fermentans TaxID=43671 RepID=A0A511YWQ9_9CELL|nr:thioredoxin family protein [Actinotalea fermentans]GEN79566.1 hypothetical protein AFE02nite_13000 [Actinotalea fermentans]